MGESHGGVTNWYRTLKDFSLTYLKDACEGRIDDVDGRHAYFWTPNCYFGRPGGYMNYRFLLVMDNCNFSIMDTFEFTELVCDAESHEHPYIAFVSEADDNEAAFKAVSDFLYWDHID